MVVKRVAAKFPYESADDKQPCLKKESGEVTKHFITGDDVVTKGCKICPN